MTSACIYGRTNGHNASLAISCTASPPCAVDSAGITAGTTGTVTTGASITSYTTTINTYEDPTTAFPSM